MTDYERGSRDGVERAAQKVCMLCQQGWKLEEREIPWPDGSSKVLPSHQYPDGTLAVCSAADIRALTPGHDQGVAGRKEFCAGAEES